MKQVILLRKDLKMSPGKAVAQGAHASVGAVQRTPYPILDEWQRTGTTKVVLAVDSADLLLFYLQEATARYLPACLVCDEGRTEVPPGSATALAIGPDSNEAIDDVTGKLPLYK